ncbi:acyltransferase [Bradyrhizobium sp. U87765 SZCCT0131]|uniref:acyltransferase family protein n=1 Tax=unclassified Bradyrhizobium TaxID=2631580 RepID=UPI001BA9A215|nr:MULTISPECIES: acyltransferase [unclassified Bradyrhizobium]MBR1219385.1 acyltransferase [Bradyrhizobium sp. U87765 SZCCT0131]MBR1262036.1 acyltransferase [Bradyrhizobium sp. U87765 SZCCT0134]MBR1306111.1 acyltransferase [Bradyrhizobium sp. U87765 SZCCT0110]MBR1317818.1 acyltransferase [Bradyrhizobium sp. U87765 SZCCT0109]MBR1351520.1 acyltransferase [Bradyrhizobium sp. U87765 SZCCT0048]
MTDIATALPAGRTTTPPATAVAAEHPEARRIPALDGLRGLATIMVILSHYFGEVEHGLRAIMVGWLAVDIFFVLSGFLIGKLILERRAHANFFAVFYVRRACRIVPAYVLTLLAVTLLYRALPYPWTEASDAIPLWGYLTFVQNIFMVATDSIGAHWLAPTWTLAVEEHFYLLVPALIVFAPRRWIVRILTVATLGALVLRGTIAFGGHSPMAALVLLPGRADILACGVLAAIAITTRTIDWPRFVPAIRVAPLVLIVAALALRIVDTRVYDTFGALLIGAGCAAFLLCIVLGTPEAARFRSKTLQFFGNNGYCLYLTHLPILGLMHGLLLGATPGLGTPAQWAVTIAALPVCVLVGWGMTRLVEEPLTRYGRTWRWSTAQRGEPRQAAHDLAR